MARPNKANTVAELADHFRTSNAAVLTEYRGLTVAQLKTLRRTLGSTVTYAVVKNTLTKIAAKAGAKSAAKTAAKPAAKPAAKAAATPSLPKPAAVAKPKTPAGGDDDWETF